MNAWVNIRSPFRLVISLLDDDRYMPHCRLLVVSLCQEHLLLLLYCPPIPLDAPSTMRHNKITILIEGAS